MTYGQDFTSLAEKGELPLFTSFDKAFISDTFPKAKAETHPHLRSDQDGDTAQYDWLDGKRWKYRVILAFNLVLIIGGQYAFLAGVWPHFCVVSIFVGADGLLNVLTPYLERGPRWPTEYSRECLLALVHAHFMVSVSSVISRSDLGISSIVDVILCKERIPRLLFDNRMLVVVGVLFCYNAIVRCVEHLASRRPLIPRDDQGWKGNVLVEIARQAVRDGGLVLFFLIYGDRVPPGH